MTGCVYILREILTGYVTRDGARDSNDSLARPSTNYQQPAPGPGPDDHSCNLMSVWVSVWGVWHSGRSGWRMHQLSVSPGLKLRDTKLFRKEKTVECKDKGAAMTTGSAQQFHDFKIYNCSSKYTFSLVRLIYCQVKSSIYLEICLFSSFYLLLTPKRSRGIVMSGAGVATYSAVTTT